MHESEVKLLTVKSLIQSEIATSKHQIDYEIKKGAANCRELLQKIKPGDNECRTISKEDYELLWHYLRSVENECIYNYKGAEYTKQYYVEIETKKKILNQL